MVQCSRTARGPYDYIVVALPRAVRVQCSRTARAVRLHCSRTPPGSTSTM